jgi:shikimate dehydrogenase
MAKCISIASRPSNFGRTMFSAAFRAKGLDWTYEPQKVETVSELEEAIKYIRDQDIRGCGVSMPWKSDVIKYLDAIDPAAQRIGAINTLVNESGHLTGYNTDYFGAQTVLKYVSIGKNSEVLLLGTGGAAKAVACAMTDFDSLVFVSGRTPEHLNEFCKKYRTVQCRWEDRNDLDADLLINCTNVGMSPHDGVMPVADYALRNFGMVADYVINPPKTKLIQIAEEKDIYTIPGYEFTLHQAAKQFGLYTGKEAPLEAMQSAMQTLLR